jgi:hypothetical protein
VISLALRFSARGTQEEALTRRPLLEQVYCSEVFEPAGQPTFHLPAILDNLTPLARACSSLVGAADAPMAAATTRRLVSCMLMELIFRRVKELI